MERTLAYSKNTHINYPEATKRNKATFGGRLAFRDLSDYLKAPIMLWRIFYLKSYKRDTDKM